jgi:hypothetical protein
MTPQEIFENQIATRLQNPAQQAKAKEIDAVYQFNVNGRRRRSVGGRPQGVQGLLRRRGGR